MNLKIDHVNIVLYHLYSSKYYLNNKLYAFSCSDFLRRKNIDSFLKNQFDNKIDFLLFELLSPRYIMNLYKTKNDWIEDTLTSNLRYNLLNLTKQLGNYSHFCFHVPQNTDILLSNIGVKNRCLWYIEDENISC